MFRERSMDFGLFSYGNSVYVLNITWHTVHFLEGKDRWMDGGEVKERGITKAKVKAGLRENL